MRPPGHARPSGAGLTLALAAVLVGFAAVLGVASDVTAQIEPGRVYSGGEQISEPAAGSG